MKVIIANLKDGRPEEEREAADDEKGDGRDVDVEHRVPVPPDELYRNSSLGVLHGVVNLKSNATDAVLNQVHLPQVNNIRICGTIKICCE